MTCDKMKNKTAYVGKKQVKIYKKHIKKTKNRDDEKK